MTDVTTAEREQALAEVVEERVLSKREQDRLRQEAEEAEVARLERLQGHQDTARAAVGARLVLVPAFTEKLVELVAIGEHLLDAHEAFVKARTGAEKAGGSLTIGYPSPPYGVEHMERELLRRVRDMLQSIAGRV